MIRHFFLDKTTTIVKGSSANLGLNPIVELNYGDAITRFLIHFDISEIKELIEDKTFAKPESVTYKLKMKNCFSIDGLPYDQEHFFGGSCGIKQRASSFNVICFKIPKEFDEGRGYEYTKDMWQDDHRSFSFSGANWFQAQNGYLWDEEGIYSNERLEEEYVAFMNGDVNSVVIGREHFDFGDEDIEFDITKHINDLLSGECLNYGLAFAFSPALEATEMERQQFVSFFSRHTNTFYCPYIEADYKEYISDDRASFYVGRENKLYLYSFTDGTPTNLDELPSCTINGVGFDVEQVQKGVYCAKIQPSIIHFEPNTIYYDVWSNLLLNGTPIEDVEMEFVALPYVKFASVGIMAPKKDILIPSFDGINDGEQINIGETREIGVDFRLKYTTEKKAIIDSAAVRLYVKDGEREIEVYDGFTPIEHTFLRNFFVINTVDFMPNEYHIDIKVSQGREVHTYKDAIRFKIVSDLSKRYI